MLAAGFALAVAVAGSAAAQPERGPSRTGHVEFITGRRAYLDRGALDGLVEGQILELLRGGRPALRCAVERVADRTAVCTGPGIRVGDWFRVDRPHPRSALAERALPPPADAAAIDARARVLARSRFEKVVFAGRDRNGIDPAISVGMSARAWSGTASTLGIGAYVAEQVDATIQRLPIAETDFRFDLSFTALRWQLRPDPARYEPGRRTQFFLWEAEVSRREIDDRTVLAAGRLWPWHLPGLPMLDGLQVGRRTARGTAEAGAYLGTLPTADGLAPTRTGWAFGAYATVAYAPAHRDLLPTASLEARAGARQSPLGGQAREAELLGQLWARRWVAAGGARGSQAVGGNGLRALEQAHVDVRLSDGGPLGGWVQARYVGPSPDTALVLLRDEAPNRAGAYHAALGARFDAWTAVGVALSADAHQDRATAMRSVDATLELRLPRLFSDAGGLWLAATGTEGWVRSRGGYAQYWGAPLAGLRVLARLGARATEFTGPNPNPDATELGASLQVDAPIRQRVRLRGRSSLVVPLSVQAEPPISSRASYQMGIDAAAAF